MTAAEPVPDTVLRAVRSIPDSQPLTRPTCDCAPCRAEYDRQVAAQDWRDLNRAIRTANSLRENNPTPEGAA